VRAARAELAEFLERESTAVAGEESEWLTARVATYRQRGLTDIYELPEAIVTEALSARYPVLYVAMDSMAHISQELSSFTRGVITELWNTNSHVRGGLVRGAYKVVQAWQRAGASELWRTRHAQVDMHHMFWIGHIYTLRLWSQPGGQADHDRAGEVMFAVLISAVMDGYENTTERSVFWYRQLVVRMRSLGEPMTEFAIALMASELIALAAVAEAKGRHAAGAGFVDVMLWAFDEIKGMRPRWSEADWRGIVGTTASHCENYGGSWPLMQTRRLQQVVSPDALREFADRALRRISDPQFS
jgi:hypothetical protein